MKISVIIIALWNRRTLEGCINAVCNQSRLPDEVVVIGGKTNVPKDLSLKQQRSSLVSPLHYFAVSSTGIVFAVNAGINNSSGDVLVFTEDDIIPYPNWIECIEFYLGCDDTGGVGGPDEIWRDGTKEREKRIRQVGRRGLGRIIGGHNGNAPDQDVDFLKGCNMAIKRSVCPHLDKNLIGFYRWEQDVCLYVKNKGKRLIYRNDVRVRHIKESGYRAIKEDMYLAITHPIL